MLLLVIIAWSPYRVYWMSSKCHSLNYKSKCILTHCKVRNWCISFLVDIRCTKYPKSMALPSALVFLWRLTVVSSLIQRNYLLFIVLINFRRIQKSLTQFNLLFWGFHKEFKHFIVLPMTDLTQLTVTVLVPKEQILFGFMVCVQSMHHLPPSEVLGFWNLMYNLTLKLEMLKNL